MNPKRHKAAYLGMLSTAAILLGYVESIAVVFPVPGMKLGLPNLAVVTVLYLYSWREALAVSVVRIAVNWLLFGNTFGMWFSLAGGLFSLACMAAVKRLDLFDCVGVSLVGGITHNLGQIVAAVILVENVRIAYYFIPLAIAGLAAGAAIGLLSGILVRRLSPIAPDINKSGR